MSKSIGRLVSILHRNSQIYFNHVLKDFNITSSEYSFLLYLFHNDGIIQDDLSNYLCIDKAATARAIKSLEEKGYVTRNKDTLDKRCNRVYLTEMAKSYSQDIINRVLHWSEILSENMDKETKDIVYNSLESMVKKVEQMNFKKETEDI
jgi:DNA-binding MarR family transcriptional regulator